jgi:hypothetical protein
MPLLQTSVTGKLRWLATALGLVLLSGCGLSEYEKKMLQAQVRVQQFDEENRLLGDPLVIPTRTDAATKGQVPVANVFLRPPKGIQDKPGAPRGGGLPYRYLAAVPKDALCTAVEMDFGKPRIDLGSRAVVAGWFPTVRVPELQQQEIAGRSFLVAEFDYDLRNNESCAVYVTPAEPGQTQVAIVYWLSSKQKEQARSVLALSLKSLALDVEAGLRRAGYAQRTPWPANKP